MLFKFCCWKRVASITLYSDFQSAVADVFPGFAPCMEQSGPLLPSLALP